MNFDIEILQNGLTVLLIGFSIVFCFLVVLIFSMQIMGKVVQYLNKLFPVAAPAGASVKAVAKNSDDEIAVAIVAAIMKDKN